MLELLYALLVTVTGIDRSVDANLAAAAQQRAETVICADQATFYNHEGHPAGAYEILICFADDNATYQQAVNGWMASPVHRGVLLNGTLRAIGCGTAVTAGYRMFACEVAKGGLANTALPLREGALTALGVLLVTAASVLRRRRARE